MLVLKTLGEKQYKFEEILPIYKVVSAETDIGTFADFKEAFKTFDREGQGYMNSAELRHVLTMMGKYIIKKKLKQSTRNFKAIWSKLDTFVQSS